MRAVSSSPQCWPLERLKRVEQFAPGLLSPKGESCRTRLLMLRNGRQTTARNPPGARMISPRTLSPRGLTSQAARSPRGKVAHDGLDVTAMILATSAVET